MLETLRYELKFSMPFKDAELLKKKLQALLDFDMNGDQGTYNIKSLYFDDFYSTSLGEKLDGVDKGPKFRIRIYQDDLSCMKLESKQKKGDIVSKKSLLVDKDAYEQFVQNSMAFKDRFPSLYNRLLKPKVIVSYDRTALVYEPGHVRITFDTNLKASINHQPCLFKPASYIPSYPENIQIFEVKYTGFLPSHLKGVFNEARAKQSISKYAICRLQGIN